MSDVLLAIKRRRRSEEDSAPDFEERNLLPRCHLVDRTLADAEILCGFTESEDHQKTKGTSFQVLAL